MNRCVGLWKCILVVQLSFCLPHCSVLPSLPARSLSFPLPSGLSLSLSYELFVDWGRFSPCLVCIETEAKDQDNVKEQIKHSGQFLPFSSSVKMFSFVCFCF